MTSFSSQNPMILAYVLSGVVALVGLLGLLIGLRGRAIDDHPWCRACRFDVFGLDTDRCPECGATLSKPGAIRRGQRRQRRGLVVGGALLMLLGLAGLGAAGWADWSGVNWQHHKPVSWLMREADLTPGPTSDAALAELGRRYDAGELSAAEVDKVVESALKHQADPARPWQFAWGNFFEQALRDGHVSDDQRRRYAEGIIADPFILQVRPEVVSGSHRIAVQWTDNTLRMGDAWGRDYWMKTWGGTIRIGPLTKAFTSESGSMITSPRGAGSSTDYFTMDPEQWDKLSPGRHKVSAETDVALFENSSQDNDLGLALAHTRVKAETQIIVLPPGRSTVTLITDPAYQQQVEDAVRLKQLTTRQWSYQVGTGKWYLDLNFEITPRLFSIAGTGKSRTHDGVTESSVQVQPIDLAFDIIVRHEGVEHPVGWMAMASDKRTSLGTGGNIDAELAGQSVDLILRPSVERAESSIDCFEIWGDEIVFEGVVVEKKP